jgi:hypothetical protein
LCWQASANLLNSRLVRILVLQSLLQLFLMMVEPIALLSVSSKLDSAIFTSPKINFAIVIVMIESVLSKDELTRQDLVMLLQADAFRFVF